MHTHVISVSSEQGGKHTVLNSRGSTRAQKIIFVTNAYTTGIVPSYYQKIVPTRATCSHFGFPGTQYPPAHLTHTYGLSYANGYRDYLIPRPDGGMICRGAKYTYGEDKELCLITATTTL